MRIDSPRLSARLRCTVSKPRAVAGVYKRGVWQSRAVHARVPAVPKTIWKDGQKIDTMQFAYADAELPDSG